MSQYHANAACNDDCTANTTFLLPEIRQKMLRSFWARLDRATAERDTSHLPLQHRVQPPQALNTHPSDPAQVDTRQYAYQVELVILSKEPATLVEVLQEMPEVLGHEHHVTDVLVQPAQKPDYKWLVHVTSEAAQSEASNSRALTSYRATPR